MAFEPLGWRAAWLSEIDPFACALLAHRYPETPNVGDMRTIPRRVLAAEIDAPDVLCGGTPCQAFSVAGLRESLSDERGNLSLKSWASAERCTPAVEWAGWPEQIPAFTRRLQGVLIENAPAIEVIQRQDKLGALHYVDPPYVHSTRSSRQGGRGGMGYAHEMKDADHRELAAVLRGVRGMVMLSGYRSALYDELYGDWARFEHKASADMGQARIECLWLNAAAQAGAIQMGLL